MTKILLVGGYGYQDKGDDAQLSAVLANMKRFIPTAYLLVLSDNPENLPNYRNIETDFSINYYLHMSLFKQKMPNENLSENPKKSRNSVSLRSIITRHYFEKLNPLFISLILIFNARRLRKGKKTLFLNDELKHFLLTLKSSDLLFSVGGGNIASVWRSELRSKCLLFFLYRILEKPIILSGQTIGPFHGILDSFIARYALNRVNLITLREQFSEKILKKLGVNEPLIRVTADDSITLVPPDQIKTKAMTEAGLDVSKRPLIGINITGLRYLQNLKAKFKKSEEILAQVADYLVSKHNATVVFVPMQYGADGDERPMKRIIRLMQNKQRAILLSQEYEDKTIKGIIGQLDLVIGLRYHFIVFAVTSGVPAIGIYIDDYYSAKIKGILDLVGQESNALNIEETSLENLIELIESIFSNREYVVHNLRERTKILGKRSLSSIKFAAKILSLQSNFADTVQT